MFRNHVYKTVVEPDFEIQESLSQAKGLILWTFSLIYYSPLVISITNLPLIDLFKNHTGVPLMTVGIAVEERVRVTIVVLIGVSLTDIAAEVMEQAVIVIVLTMQLMLLQAIITLASVHNIPSYGK